MNISDAELKLLEVLWSESPLTVGQVIERVQIMTDWHANTIKTMLTRLIKKQAISRYKDGKRFFYTPAIERDVVVMEEAEGFLKKFFDGGLSPFVAHFSKNKKLSKTEISELEQILSKMKKDND